MCVFALLVPVSAANAALSGSLDLTYGPQPKGCVGPMLVRVDDKWEGVDMSGDAFVWITSSRAAKVKSLRAMMDDGREVLVPLASVSAN
ncbi:MAG: hypothetical protein JWN72_512 [Thermoleophilia bacterium]|nr:hypothetical protein [Thermoleophilia bacterium]